MLVPKLFTVFKEYDKEQFVKDIIAGVIVAIIALPLSIALAIASGVTPEKGLHTAIIAGFFVSLLGGSRVQIGGPTGAFVIIVFGIIQQYGLEGLTVATIMAGAILMLMGLLQFGSVIKFIPYPITTGFTSGIAVVIFTTQVKDFFGLKIEHVPSEFLEKWKAYIENMNTLNVHSFIIGLVSLMIIVLWPRINRKIPGSFVALIVTVPLALLLHLDVETIGSRFGEISSSLPKFAFPKLNFQTIRQLIHPAITIALLAGVESLLSAVVADGMVGGKHRSNMELVAQGVANIFSSLFGGIPATGAIARTAANVKNGGRTPVAGMVHALALLVILVLVMPYAKYIPLSSLAAILIVVSYNMSEWRAFKNLMKAPKSDVAVLLITFLLTVMMDLVVAIEVGMILAAFLFIKRMADVTYVQSITDELKDWPDFDDPDAVGSKEIHESVAIFEINGPFFFGAADKFVEIVDKIQGPIEVLILRMRNVPAMDATAYHALYRLFKKCRHQGTKLMISHIQSQPLKMLKKNRFIEELGEENLCKNLDEALEKAKGLILGKEVLQKGCPKKHIDKYQTI